MIVAVVVVIVVVVVAAAAAFSVIVPFYVMPLFRSSSDTRMLGKATGLTPD